MADRLKVLLIVASEVPSKDCSLAEMELRRLLGDEALGFSMTRNTDATVMSMVGRDNAAAWVGVDPTYMFVDEALRRNIRVFNWVTMGLGSNEWVEITGLSFDTKRVLPNTI